MIFAKKSLGQNFLKDKNILNKIINLNNLKEKNVIEIGPGKGNLTDEILKKKPESLIIIEKDFSLSKELKIKYSKNKNLKVFNDDILSFDINKIVKKNTVILGNLPYNISSQILVKIIKLKKLRSCIDGIIFMFQKELGEKIISKFPSPKYGRLSILTNLKLNIENKFLVSPNCFVPRPKVTSMVIYFKVNKNVMSKIKKIENLELVTNILFSNKRKMINKNIKKILDSKKITKIKELKLNVRPTELGPQIFYKITELFEK